MGRYDETDPLGEHGIDLNALLVAMIDRSKKTRYEIAGELGVSQAALSRAYTGIRPATLELVCLVAKATGHRVSVQAKRQLTGTKDQAKSS